MHGSPHKVYELRLLPSVEALLQSMDEAVGLVDQATLEAERHNVVTSLSEEDTLVMTYSCTPFRDSINVEPKDGRYVVKWSCDTLGFHCITCDSEEEAQREVERLKAIPIPELRKGD